MLIAHSEPMSSLILAFRKQAFPSHHQPYHPLSEDTSIHSLGKLSADAPLHNRANDINLLPPEVSIINR